MKMRRTSTVSGMGERHLRLFIPLDIAKELGLKPGDVMLWALDGTTITLERADEQS